MILWSCPTNMGLSYLQPSFLWEKEFSLVQATITLDFLLHVVELILTNRPNIHNLLAYNPDSSLSYSFHRCLNNPLANKTEVSYCIFHFNP